MNFFKAILLLVTALLKFSDEVKVNMQGSISLGKEVVETLSYFVNKEKLSGRRTFGHDAEGKSDGDTNPDSDTIALIVNAKFLCRDLSFCQGDIGKLLNKYIITLTKAVESVFEILITDNDKKQTTKQENNTPKVLIFEEELRYLLNDIKKLLRNANEKITEDNEAYTWIDLIKRINSKFQDRATMFASQRLEGNVQEITEVKKKLVQKLTIATTLIELEFENKMCAEYNVCSKSHEVTIGLNTLMEQIKTVPDERAKEFIRHFYETLPGTNFYYRISDITGHEFQSILHDMAYAENIPTKNVLSIVQKSIEDRLNAITSISKLEKPNGRDVKLLHIILSDMDHFYSKQKKEPFRDFLGDFFEWSKQGGRFSSQLRRIMKDVQNLLSYESDELVLKLVNEVRVFMEVAVDPAP